MILSAIAAMSRNRVIGRANQLPWNIPEDMKYFRDKTKGRIMIMGRKTFESFGGKVLPGRFHIVITRQADYKFAHPQVKIVSSLEEAISAAKPLINQYGEEVFVIGGGEIYKQSLPVLDRLYLTIIEEDYDGDAWFPEFDDKILKLKNTEKRQGFSFNIYEK
jgi:dihydrofolate reductase